MAGLGIVAGLGSPQRFPSMHGLYIRGCLPDILESQHSQGGSPQRFPSLQGLYIRGCLPDILESQHSEGGPCSSSVVFSTLSSTKHCREPEDLLLSKKPSGPCFPKFNHTFSMGFVSSTAYDSETADSPDDFVNLLHVPDDFPQFPPDFLSTCSDMASTNPSEYDPDSDLENDDPSSIVEELEACLLLGEMPKSLGSDDAVNSSKGGIGFGFSGSLGTKTLPVFPAGLDWYWIHTNHFE